MKRTQKRWGIAMRAAATGCMLVACLHSGCNGRPAASGAHVDEHASTPIDEHDHAHDHAQEGPHHGVLVELGQEEYHAEVAPSLESITVWLLDKSAARAVMSDAPWLNINVVVAGQPQQIKLLPVSSGSDQEGKHSCYSIKDRVAVRSLRDSAKTAKLCVTIDGTAYRGEIVDSHSHAGHKH